MRTSTGVWMLWFGFCLAACAAQRTATALPTFAPPPQPSATARPTPVPTTPVDAGWQAFPIVFAAAPLHFQNQSAALQMGPVVGSAVSMGADGWVLSFQLELTGSIGSGAPAGLWLRAADPGAVSAGRGVLIGRQNGMWVVIWRETGSADRVLDRFLPDDRLQARFWVQAAADGRQISLRLGEDEKQVLLPAAVYGGGQNLGLEILCPAGAEVLLREAVLYQPGAWVLPNQALPGLPLRELADRRGLQIGAAASAFDLVEDPRYGAALSRDFNLVSLPQAFDWNNIHPKRDALDFTQADQMIDWASAHGMQVRGELLPSLGLDVHLPDWLLSSDLTRPDLMRASEYHLEALLSRYRDSVDEWVVARDSIWRGRAVSGNRLGDLLGEEGIVYVFRYARRIDPQARLIYAFQQNTGTDAASNAVYAHVKRLLQAGAPIDAVGIEAHLSTANAPKPARLMNNLRRYAQLGLLVTITGLTVDVQDGQTGVSDAQMRDQAAVYRSLMEACLTINAEEGRMVCTGVTLSGVSDGSGWATPANQAAMESPLLLDTAYRSKPAYQAVQETLERFTPTP